MKRVILNGTSRDFITVQLTSKPSWDFKRSHWFRRISYDFRREVSVAPPCSWFNVGTANRSKIQDPHL